MLMLEAKRRGGKKIARERRTKVEIEMLMSGMQRIRCGKPKGLEARSFIGMTDWDKHWTAMATAGRVGCRMRISMSPATEVLGLHQPWSPTIPAGHHRPAIQAFQGQHRRHLSGQGGDKARLSACVGNVCCRDTATSTCM